MLFYKNLISIFIFSLCFNPLAFAESYQLRVMSYNINGLPWPLEKNKKPLFMEMARLINEQKKIGKAPHIILLQEGFRGNTKDLVNALNYPYVIQGPKDSDKNPLDGDTNSKAIVGAGLWILSQYPMVKGDAIAFGASRCTGSDCYANKGVAYVQINVPSLGLVDIFSTHMNSRKASGSPDEKVWATQRQQIQVAKYFFDKNSSLKNPVIFAGDFNVKTEYPTYADLAKAIPLNSAGLYCEAYPSLCKIGENTDPKKLHGSVDQHFYRGNSVFQLSPMYAAKTMRQMLGDKPLSDHLAYLVHYKFDRK